MGVPVTFGCDDLIAELGEILKSFQDEMTLTKVAVMADSRLFTTIGSKQQKPTLPDSRLFRLVQGMSDNVGDGNFWQVFSPTEFCVTQAKFTDASLINGLNFKMAQIEKAIGVSSGILTDMATRAAMNFAWIRKIPSATEIEYSSFDTEVYADAIHKNIERGVRDALSACAVYANALGVPVPDGYELTFDWMSWSERSSERFSQLLDGMKSGAVNPEELRMYLFDEDAETARAGLPDTTALLEARL
jgi:hypothetical protein